jgi:hypothetical protein
MTTKTGSALDSLREVSMLLAVVPPTRSRAPVRAVTAGSSARMRWTRLVVAVALGPVDGMTLMTEPHPAHH